MMIKSIVLLTIGISGACTVYAVESAINLAVQFSGKPRLEQKMENLPSGREQEVLDALAKLGDFDVLLRLNHGPTVERVVGGFIKKQGRASTGRKNIERSGSPYIIDELAPQLYKQDGLQARSFDGEDFGMDHGESAQAAEMIGQLIIRAPEFPPEAKEWAKKHLGGPRSDIIQAARAWWELNQAALLANQFDQVRQPESDPKATAAPVPITDPLAFPDKTTPPPVPAVEPAPPPPSPEPAPAPAAPPPAPPQTPPAEPSSPRWWILAALALLGAGLLIARRKKT